MHKYTKIMHKHCIKYKTMHKYTSITIHITCTSTPYIITIQFYHIVKTSNNIVFNTTSITAHRPSYSQPIRYNFLYHLTQAH